jgi:hypothetical protein
MQKKAASLISIRTSDDFVPRLGFSSRIRTALGFIEPLDLEGIDFVFVFEEVPPPTPGKNRELDEALREGLLLFAAYNYRSATWPPHIILIARNLCKPVPRLIRHSPALTLWIAENLAHEVGHHLIAEKKFRLGSETDRGRSEPEEEFADQYALSITTKMKGSLRYRVGDLLLGIAAQINYAKGIRCWKKQEYRLAADYFYMTTQLRKNHKEASYWFWRAKEKAPQS